MDIMDRFFKALRDGDPVAQQAEADVWAAHVAAVSDVETAEYTAERIARWAEQTSAQKKVAAHG